MFFHIEILHLNLGHLVRSKISEVDALRMATIYAAELLDVNDRGELLKGKRADIIAVNSNSLEGISTMESMSFIMKEGVIFKE